MLANQSALRAAGSVSEQASAVSQWFHQFAQAARGGVAVELVRGYIQHQFFPLFTVGLWFDSVAPQEHDCGHHRRAFVPIEKRVVLANVKQIRRCDLDDIGIRGIAAEARLRREHSRGEKVFVADTS